MAERAEGKAGRPAKRIEAREIADLTSDLAVLVLQARGYAVPPSFNSDEAIDRLMNFLFEMVEKIPETPHGIRTP